MKIENLKRLDKIAILGYGKEGKSTKDFLLSIGINKEKITILDKENSVINNEEILIISGENYLDNLGDFDIIFKTPGISPYNKKILPYREKLTSQAEVFFDNYEGKVIGITATKGKSTTSTLIYETLKNAGLKVKLVGNIGNPVLDEINLISKEKYDFVVYELSSYMLEMFQPNCFIAVLGNIYTDHLDWHGNNFENYKNAKLNITKKSDNIVIRDDLYKNNLQIFSGKNNIYTFGLNGDYLYKDGKFFIGDKFIFDNKNILLQGEHNMINICSVLGVLFSISKIKEGENNFIKSLLLAFLGLFNNKFSLLKLLNSFINVLKNFSGLPHRMQKIGEYNGITFIDDAISTTPESTIEAIKTFGEKIGTIFLGGTDRGYDFKNLVNYIKQNRIENIVLFPETGIKILNEIKKLFNNSLLNSLPLQGKEAIKMNILETSSMQKAVAFAFKYTKKGKICLLSTASPSYFLWKNYEEKGSEFKKEVKEYSKN